MPWLRCLVVTLAALGWSLVAAQAPAQTPAPAATSPKDPYPSRPVRVVVTFPPGGSTDAAMRIVAPRLAERLGQPVVVENRPGAGGGIGLAAVAKAAPDGHTLVLASAGGLTANASLYANPGYDVARDFAPITLFGTSPFVLVANAALAAPSVKEVLALARARPGALSYASGGNGTAMHLSGELMKAQSRSFIVHIPYRGSAPALLAVLSGETQLAIIDLATLRPVADSGRVKLIGVLDAQRSSLAPNVPTLAETGLPGFEASGWFALLAPAGTPAAIVERLNTEITAVLRSTEVRERFATAALEPLPSTPAALATRIRDETVKWAAVIKASGAKVD